jgi:hypothetical protein
MLMLGLRGRAWLAWWLAVASWRRASAPASGMPCFARDHTRFAVPQGQVSKHQETDAIRLSTTISRVLSRREPSSAQFLPGEAERDTPKG